MESGNLGARLVDELDEVGALVEEDSEAVANFDQSLVFMLIFIGLYFMGLNKSTTSLELVR